MRIYGVLADIHGNLPALRAVLRDARAVARAEGAPPPAFVSLGDVVGYGPWPGACLRWVRRHALLAVQGNHEAAVADDGPPRGVAAQLWPLILWTRQALTLDERATARAWPLSAVGEDDLAPFTLFHSSLADPDAYIDHPAAARAALLRLGTPYGLFGHTHLQCVYTQGLGSPALLLAHREGERPREAEGLEIGRWHPAPTAALRALINPGSVGQPRRHPLLLLSGLREDLRAHYLLIRRDAAGRLSLRFQRVAYPQAQTVAALRRRIRWSPPARTGAAPHPLLAPTLAAMPELLPPLVEHLAALLGAPADTSTGR